MHLHSSRRLNLYLPDSYPLPTEYWTRPIYGENPYWYTVSSNWLGTGRQATMEQPIIMSGTNWVVTDNNIPSDAVGSLTGHIMWTKVTPERRCCRWRYRHNLW